MTTTRTACRSFATALGLGAGAYAAYVGSTWASYGRPRPPRPEEADPLLDRLMPAYEVAERHHVSVAAPPGLTLAAAAEIDLRRSTIARAMFKGRELLLRAEPDTQRQPRGLLEEVQALGWQVLADIPGREVVVGAATRPWEPDVTFRGVPADEFPAFDEPDYVKIAWTLRADAVGSTESIFRTETRVVSTDAAARAKFRRYWAALSPGIILIRWALLRPVKLEAERRARGQRAAASVVPFR